MPFYRFCFIDTDRQIVGHHTSEMRGTEEARIFAGRLLSSSPYAGIEVWEGQPLVCSLFKADGTASGGERR
jgi:hypothetical protein